MRKSLTLAAVIFLYSISFAQNIDKIITAAEVERIEKVLSADDMKGRKTFSPDIDRAGDFIAAEFKQSGLGYLNGLSSYRQEFTMTRAKFISATGTFDGQPLDAKNIVAFTSSAEINITEAAGYEKATIAAGANFNAEAFKYIQGDKNYLVIVDTAQAKGFARLPRYKRETFKSDRNVIFILSATTPSSYQLNIKHEITASALRNIVGVLPGKSKATEYVVFSGHYDHLGVGKPNEAGDSIYNGANDDAAGTTAVIMLANYFSKLHNNERTLIFVAFTAEEIGGFGSQYFSRQLDADKVTAMFNIEMIGTESKWGTNSAYITGYEKSDMGRILQTNLANSKFHFEPDPYPDQNLFYRSDNATLAALGVPAHTISTSKMDSEKYYHKQGDEISTLDMANMTEIIKAIAISSSSIVNGIDAPTRVEKAK